MRFGSFRPLREDNVMAFRIIEEKCIGCGACAWVCLFDVPAPANDDASKYVINTEKCIGCGHCENICPNNAIEPMHNHKKIKRVSITAENCIGCTLCAHICPAQAPTGERKKPFVIDQSKCFKCGACAAKCRHNAITVEYFDA